jgi:hypothetical protein
MKNILLLLFIITAGWAIVYKMELPKKHSLNKTAQNNYNSQQSSEVPTSVVSAPEGVDIITTVRTKYYNLIEHFLYDINITKECIFILVVTLFLILTLRILHLWVALRIFSEVLFNLSYFTIALISIISLDMKYIFSVNVWYDTNYILLWFPLELLCISALGLYLLDFNFPIWRVVYNSLLFPICSFILIVVRDYIPI